MSFEISERPEFTAEMAELQTADPKKYAKALRTLIKLANNPKHPGLQSHPYPTSVFADVTDAEIWESYVENATAKAWRIWWCYGPERGQITVLRIGPHSTRREK